MKKLLIGAGLVLLLAGGGLAYMVYRNASLATAFKTLADGDPEAKVVAAMGRPDEIVVPGGEEFWAPPHSGGVKEYHYYAWVWPEIWVITFDAAGTIVYRNHNVM